MTAAVAACGGREQVNDDPQTAPSRRLASLFRDHVLQRYDKITAGYRSRLLDSRQGILDLGRIAGP